MKNASSAAVLFGPTLNPARFSMTKIKYLLVLERLRHNHDRTSTAYYTVERCFATLIAALYAIDDIIEFGNYEIVRPKDGISLATKALLDPSYLHDKFERVMYYRHDPVHECRPDFCPACPYRSNCPEGSN